MTDMTLTLVALSVLCAATATAAETVGVPKVILDESASSLPEDMLNEYVVTAVDDAGRYEVIGAAGIAEKLGVSSAGALERCRVTVAARKILEKIHSPT